jgi:hypothetical protein
MANRNNNKLHNELLEISRITAKPRDTMAINILNIKILQEISHHFTGTNLHRLVKFTTSEVHPSRTRNHDNVTVSIA